MNVLERLKKYQDADYLKFNSKLIPGIKSIGVKTPYLKEIAKELVKNNELSFFNESHLYHEEWMIHMYMLSFIKDKEIVYKELDKIVPIINNWAMCDSLMNIKLIKKNREYFYKLINKYKKSNNEFEIRFVMVMLLNHYMDINYLKDTFNILDNTDTDKYYSRMAMSWLLAECIIHFRTETFNYLNNTKVDDWTFNKAIQKACESFRVSDEDKILLKSMKR